MTIENLIKDYGEEEVFFEVFHDGLITYRLKKPKLLIRGKVKTDVEYEPKEMVAYLVGILNQIEILPL